MIYEKPIFFEKNRVFRVYTGGKLLGEFTGDNSIDDFYPEEWIASSVKALNLNSSDEHEGVSKIEGSNLYFDEALEKYKTEMLGDKEHIGILVKYLDSAIRLPVQAHPNKAFSKKHFNSPYGKEECWYVLGTRPDACVYFGFKEGVTKDNFAEAVLKSETDKDAMEQLLVKYQVKKGDFVFIPAKAVHAIGKGCLILEIQEPTDFTIQPERFCGDYKLSDKEMYIGLSKDDAFDCFDFESSKNPFLKPIKWEKTNGCTVDNLIDSSITESFKLNRIILNDGSYKLQEKAAVFMVTSGNGKIIGPGYERELKQSDYFFLPAAAADKFEITAENLEILCAYA